MSKEWKYQYDAQGNRVGLIEVDTSSDDDFEPQYNGMYSQLERQIILRERQKQVRYDISFREQAIADMEREILQERHKSGYCPAEIDEIDEHWYQTQSGQWKVERIYITTQNEPYIYSQIQQRLTSFHVNHMTFVDIRETLDIVSAAFKSAEIRNLRKPLVRMSQSRIKKIA